MEFKELSSGDHGRTYLLVFSQGDEVMETLSGWCEEHRITAARFTAIGAFRDAVLGWFDWEAREYREIPIDDQVEVLALTGDVAMKDERPVVHAHAVVSGRDGNARGGHLMHGHVRPTLELVLDEVPAHLAKRHDDASGLALISP
ncbi:MAG: DNA-binding protein [Gemmatimonadetes bacterium]|nr:DNA-binding protein [Gemmatimonadota bacterium]